MIASNGINGHTLNSCFPGITWSQDGKKWSLVGGTKGHDRKLSGVNGIHFDVWQLSNGRYSFALGLHQFKKKKQIDERTADTLREQFPGLFDDGIIDDAMRFEMSDLYKFLKKTREVYDFIQSAGLRYNSSVRAVQPRTSHDGWFMKRAKSLKYSHSVEDYSLFTDGYRSWLGDNENDIFFIGRSQLAASASSDTLIDREHIIPLAFIRDRVRELLDEDISTVELADFLMTHIRMVEVTREEHMRLNEKYASTMPPGWNWYDDAFARLRECGIALE